MDRRSLRLFTNRTLLFNVLSCTSFIFVELKAGQGQLVLRVYNDRELTEDEKDVYYAVYGEIKGDFIDSMSGKVDFQTTQAPYEQIDQSGDLVYA